MQQSDREQAYELPLKLDVIQMSNGVGTIIAEGSLIWWLKKADVSSPLDIYQIWGAKLNRDFETAIYMDLTTNVAI